MAQDEDVIDRTLAVFKDVSAYTIPPRMGSGGVKSGSWRTEDRIFTGRLMVMDCGSVCQLRLTGGNTCAAVRLSAPEGELFAMCPLRVGERMACVEPAADSSRNFVIRVVDPTSKRHAFLGMGFPERDDAFDFNVALSDWDKHAQGAAPGAADSDAAAAAAPRHDFSLKAGETIKVKPVASRGSGGGLLASMAALSPNSSGGGGGAGLSAPPLPASSTGSTVSGGLLPPVPAPAGGSALPPPPAAGISASPSLSNSNTTSSPSSQAAAPGQQPSADTWTAFA